jgi:hypothetical protein
VRLVSDDLELQVAQAQVSAAAAHRDRAITGADAGQIAVAEAMRLDRASAGEPTWGCPSPR